MAENIGDTLPGDTHFLGLTAIVTVGMQLVFFAIAYAFKFDKVTDFAGGTNFVLLALLTLGLGGTYTTRQILVTTFVVVSRLELAILLLTRVLKRGKDDRFDEMREKFFSFLGFWIFQMVWVWTVSLPCVYVNGSGVNPNLNGFDITGIVFWAVGFCLQMWADFVKMEFKAHTKDKAAFCDKGPWSFCRHPNYTGEILMWWGLFLMSVPVIRNSNDWGYITILSPVLTMVLLLLLSGIPTSEGSAQARYMKTPEQKTTYLNYRNQTPPIIPFPPVWYKPLPLWFKRLFCLELPMYEYDEEKQHFHQQP
eukprot:m.22402 g.22402  ORF g.22402 m.22402 type:complete len:308 (+) comp9293_c0_seq2:179-1102(+)